MLPLQIERLQQRWSHQAQQVTAMTKLYAEVNSCLCVFCNGIGQACVGKHAKAENAWT